MTVAPEYPTMSADAKGALAWLTRLQRELSVRNVTLAKYDKYYTGDHPLLFATSKFREAFGTLFREFSDNWCPLVVDAVEERLDVEGFRLPNDAPGEKKAWRYWQENQLDADSQLAHTEALINGVSYGMVWPSGEKRSPIITVEDPQQVIVAHAPGNRRLRLAALKVWIDEEVRKTYANVYLPGAIWKFEAPLGLMAAASRLAGMQQPARTYDRLQEGRWQPRVVDGEEWPLPNPLAVVPVVPLYNKPRMTGCGVSELRDVIPMQDAANKLLADMLVASEFAAFKQRWATGLEIPKDPETQKPLDPGFQHAVNRLWTSPSDKTTFGEFQVTELGNYTKAIELIVQHVASQTRTPPHYFYLSGQFPSGESIKSAETGLVAKSKRRMRHFGEGWEEIQRLAFLADGDTKRAQIVDLETVWGDPESRSEGEHVDATIKLKSLGLPLPYLWERAGLSPTDIARLPELFAQQAQILGDTDSGGDDSATVKARADAMGVLIRSGVDPESAARSAGLTRLDFTGAVPVSLRLPADEAAQVEDK